MCLKAIHCCKSTFGFLCTAAESHHDEKSVKIVEKLLLYKAQACLLVRLGLFVNNFFSKGYYVKKAGLLQENNHADVNLEFQEMVLPVISTIELLVRAVFLSDLGSLCSSIRMSSRASCLN